MFLQQAKKNIEVVVQDLICNGMCKQRLMDLGIFKGTKLIVKRCAPLGDPMIVETGDSIIAIRKSDAKSIIVE